MYLTFSLQALCLSALIVGGIAWAAHRIGVSVDCAISNRENDHV
jgi:hypothetical protein